MNLREASQQALEVLESVEPWEIVDHDPFAAAITALRAALAEEKNENIVQSTGGVHSRVSDGANRGVEPVTDCHEKEGDKVSPPFDQSEDALGMVEPVAYCTLEQLAHLKLTVPSDDKIALYTAPPKREPMTEQQLDDMFDQAEIAIYIADRQRAEHLEVYSFGVRDAEKWHGIGSEE